MRSQTFPLCALLFLAIGADSRLEAQAQPQAGSALGFATLLTFTNTIPAPIGYSPDGLILGRDGDLYGTLQQGGKYGDGAIFHAQTNGTLVWTLSLTNGQGAAPAQLFQGQDGNLYGVGSGTIFSVGTNGVFNWALAPTNGASVRWLTLGSDGNLYGACPGGGTSNYGAVVSVATNGTYNWMFSFSKTNGATPAGPIIQGADGNLYGTTTNGGGSSANGTVFSLATNGGFNWQFVFGSTNMGPFGALLQGADGRLYGITAVTPFGDAGTMFSLSTNGTFIWSYSFPNNSNPNGTLFQGEDGNLYAGGYKIFSLTTNGLFRWGSSANYPAYVMLQRADGTVYAVTGGSVGSAVVSLTSKGQTNGVSTIANTAPGNLIQDAGGNIYGTAGWTSSGGEVFELVAAPWILEAPSDVMDLTKSPASFSVSAIGAPALSYQWQKNGVKLTDVGSFSGAQSNTLVISPVSASDVGSYSVVVSNYFGAASNFYTFASSGAMAGYLSLTNSFPTLLSNATLALPNSSLFSSTLGYPSFLAAGRDGFLYGSTVFSGQYFKCATNGVLQWNENTGNFGDSLSDIIQGLDGNIYATDDYGLLVMSTNGMTISSSLGYPGIAFSSIVQGPDLRLYWTQVFGGTNSFGYVNCTSTNGSSYWSFGFDFTNGEDSSGLLLAEDGNLYGTTQFGGAYSNGTVFSMDTNGNLLWSFSFQTNGGRPASLIQGRDSNLYGISEGLSNNGCVFSISTTAELNWILPFTESVGFYPYPSLLQATDGNLYGTTRDGGASGVGTVYRLTTSGVLTIIYMFSGGSDGGFPQAGLVQVADGSLYGTTPFGGPNNAGVLYRLNLGLPPIPVAPLLQNITLAGTNFSFTWSVQTNTTYQVQYTDDLSLGTWADLGAPFSSTAKTVTVSDVITNSQRFYRAVVLLPTP